MKSFTSPVTNHTYVISLSYGRVERLQAKFGIELLEASVNQTFLDLLTKVNLRMRLLWEMLDEKSTLPEIDNPDFDPDQPESDDNSKMLSRQESFYEVLSGETLTLADEAFWEEFTDFFQSLDPSTATFIQKSKEEYKKQSAKQVQAMVEMFNDPKKEQAMTSAIEKLKTDALAQLEKEYGTSPVDSK